MPRVAPAALRTLAFAAAAAALENVRTATCPVTWTVAYSMPVVSQPTALRSAWSVVACVSLPETWRQMIPFSG